MKILIILSFLFIVFFISITAWAGDFTADTGYYIDAAYSQGTDNSDNISLSAFSDNINDKDINDINIAIRHKFINKHEIQAGFIRPCFIDNAEWESDLHNTETNIYRVRYDVPGNMGKFIASFEKLKEKSSNNENYENEVYLLGFITKIVNIYAKPLLIYRQLKNEEDNEHTDMYIADLAFDGNIGQLGFEAELSMGKANWDSGAALKDETSTVYGASLNLWHTSEYGTVGALSAYGNFDTYGAFDEKTDISTAKSGSLAHNFGTDGALLLGDTITFYKKGNTLSATGGNLYSDNDDKDDNLAGSRLFALYGNYDISDKLNIGGYAAYAKSIIDTQDNKWNGATAWELSFKAEYTIAPNMKYNLGAGMAQLEWGDDTPDPDKAYKLFNRLTLGF